MKIMYVASEAQPFAASGGLADVAGSLPKALVENFDTALVIACFCGLAVDFSVDYFHVDFLLS